MLVMSPCCQTSKQQHNDHRNKWINSIKTQHIINISIYRDFMCFRVKVSFNKLSTKWGFKALQTFKLLICTQTKWFVYWEKNDWRECVSMRYEESGHVLEMTRWLMAPNEIEVKEVMGELIKWEHEGHWDMENRWWEGRGERNGGRLTFCGEILKWKRKILFKKCCEDKRAENIKSDTQTKSLAWTN